MTKLEHFDVSDKAHWAAVFSLFLGVTSLVAAEFIPVSLLTPIAKELMITEGVAGQTVTAVGIFAVITSLVLAPLTKTIDRRKILLVLSLLLVISNCTVGMAPTYLVLIIGRGLLGICVGGFWSMASAVTLQLVPSKDVPRALSIVFSGVSVATIISLPLASYLGHILGWRNIFYLAGVMGVIAFIWQYLTLPSIPARTGNNFANMFSLFKKNWIVAGMVGTIFSYGGYHVFFTYLRPFLEQVLASHTDALAMVLLAFGVANCVGTVVAGWVLGKSFRTTMIAIHIVFAIIALCLLFDMGQLYGTIFFAVCWGLMFGFIPVGWSTWITRTLADKAEIAGGISVAAIQFSIGLAAAVGGLTFDTFGVKGIFITSTIFMSIAVVMTKISFDQFAKEQGKPA